MTTTQATFENITKWNEEIPEQVRNEEEEND